MAEPGNIVDLILKAGGVVGLGSGVAIGRYYQRFQELEKTAKKALELAVDAKDLAHTAKTAVKAEVAKGVAEVRSYIDSQIAKIGRGSIVELSLDPATNKRIADLESRIVGLETRTSSVEDDFDRRNTEDAKWQQEMQRSLGRIEGQLTPLR